MAATNLFSEATPPPAGLEIPKRALTIAAHADDAEFGAGGTLAKWADAGCEITLLIATDGSKGTWDEDTDPADLASARRDEAREAAEVLGASRDVVFLDHVEVGHALDRTREIAGELAGEEGDGGAGVVGGVKFDARHLQAKEPSTHHIAE